MTRILWLVRWPFAMPFCIFMLLVSLAVGFTTAIITADWEMFEVVPATWDVFLDVLWRIP
jgi:hypothetical protein